jgi:hypothetical protein
LDRFLSQTSNQQGLSRYIEFLRKAYNSELPSTSLVKQGLSEKSKDAIRGTKIPHYYDSGGQNILDNIDKCIRKSNSPTFAFANMMECHIPYYKTVGMPSFGDNREYFGFDWELLLDVYENGIHTADIQKKLENARDVYRANISYLDTIIYSFVNKIRELDRQTIIIITSDHGENFGTRADDNLLYHTSSLSEGLLHVPFIQIDTDNIGRRKTIDEFTSHLDLGKHVVNLCSTKTEHQYKRRKRVPCEIISMGTEPPEKLSYPKELEISKRAVYDIENNIKVIRRRDGKQKCNSFGYTDNLMLDADNLFDDCFGDWVDASASRGALSEDKTEDVEKRLEALGYK